jgi:uncharacterized membrane protein YesL
MSGNLERLTSSKAYWFLKKLVDLVILNFLFCLLSALSAMVLFFPSLVAMTTLIHKMVHDDYYNPFTGIFTEIKRQWPFMWRLEALGMGVLLFFGLAAYGYYAYYANFGMDWPLWLAVAFGVSLFLVALSLLLHLLIYNDYISDDTFAMMIRKSAVIAYKKILFTLLLIALFGCFAVVFYLVPYLLPFFSFSYFTFCMELIMKKTYTTLAREERERALLPENLFLPAVVEEKKKP